MISDINVIILKSEHPQHVNDIEAKLNNAKVRFCITSDHNTSIDHLNTLKPDLVILDPLLDSDSSLKAIQKIKILNPVTPVLTSSDECLPTGECFAPFEGVHFLKPDCEQKTLEKTVDEALVFSREYAHRPNSTYIIGKSTGIVDVRRKIRRVAEKDITVLVTGETGTGKELVARSVHFHSPRKMGPLVKVDCTSLPDELLESEIFGFQKGAFTDAYKDKPGRLEMANGGTLFVDEIGDISFSLQVKFLQVFEEKEFSRLGSTDQKIVDTRVVAATNADLWKKVQSGTFRNDLFYRLNIMQIRVPPLRERRDDIPLLIHFFLNKYCFEYKKKISEIPERVLDFLVSYNWPGNIRELENIMRRAIAVSDWSFIFQELDQSNMDTTIKPDPTNNIDLPENDSNHMRLLKLFKEQEYSLRKISKAYVSEEEHEVILDILNKTRWNRTKAAEILGVSYKTLINRMQEFGIRQ
jgi:two-component system, NtrC family, response regulator AtoC